MTNKEAMQRLFAILHDDRFSWTQESVDAFYVALEKLKNATEELKNSNDLIEKAIPSVMLKEQPEIVRCKDCEHGKGDVFDRGVVV